jgi:hypothetical protein
MSPKGGLMLYIIKRDAMIVAVVLILGLLFWIGSNL